MKRFWILCVVLLAIGLTSCTSLAQVPPEEAVQIAVTRQLAGVQNMISDELGLPATAEPTFKVEKLRIDRREKLDDPAFAADGYPSDIYRVSGIVETMLTTAEGKTQRTGPFSVYLGTNPQTDADSKNKPTGAAEPPKSETWYIVPAPKA